MTGWFEYGLLGVLVLLGFFCFLIGLDKMVKLVLGTTILIVVVLGRSALLQTWTYFLTQMGTTRTFIGLSQPTLLMILQSIDLVSSVIIFIGAMIVIITYGRIDISLDSVSLSPHIQQLVLVPLAIVSVIIGLSVAIRGVDILNPIRMAAVASTLTTNRNIQLLIRYLPLGIIVQWLISLRLIASLDIGFGYGKTSDE